MVSPIISNIAVHFVILPVKIRKYKNAGRIKRYSTLLRFIKIQFTFLPVAVRRPGIRS